MKSTTDIKQIGETVEIGFPHKRGKLLVRKEDGMIRAYWNDNMVPIKKTNDCVWIYLPRFNVRISDCECGENIVVDYDDK